MLPSGKSWGKGAIRSAPPRCIFLGLTIQLITLRTPCPKPAWSLFCYKPEVNRFYSSYKSVTKATVLISIINIHNSSSPAWQASWATPHKWTLGILMSCLLRSLVLRSWAIKTRGRQGTSGLDMPCSEIKQIRQRKQGIYLSYQLHLSGIDNPSDGSSRG